MAKSKKCLSQTDHQRELIHVYKCIKCSYVIYKKPNELPPTFCPNCAVNDPRGEMIRIERP